jgi:hypothetical protein
MEFFVKSNDEVPTKADAQKFFMDCEEVLAHASPGNLVDALSVDSLMQANPDYYGPRFDAIAELRAMDDGALYKGNEFRRVASLVNVPVSRALQMTNPGFFKDKKEFYRWLSQHPEYKTYDSRGASRYSHTYVDGKPVI